MHFPFIFSWLHSVQSLCVHCIHVYSFISWANLIFICRNCVGSILSLCDYYFNVLMMLMLFIWIHKGSNHLCQLVICRLVLKLFYKKKNVVVFLFHSKTLKKKLSKKVYMQSQKKAITRVLLSNCKQAVQVAHDKTFTGKCISVCGCNDKRNYDTFCCKKIWHSPKL